MALLTKDQILGADDRRYEDVDVPEWGGTVRVMGMTGTERNAYQASLVVMGSGGTVQRMNMADQLAKLAAKSIVDEAGERLFTDAEIKALGKKSSIALERVCTVASRLSGLRKEDVEAKAGNSEPGQSDGSTSA